MSDSAATCRHKGKREEIGNKAVRCTQCGHEWVPRGRVRVMHGTYKGYNRHNKVRGGRWPWPACEPCQDAATAWRSEYNENEDVRAARRIRSGAHQAAMMRIKRTFPMLYATLYAEEMRRRDKTAVRHELDVPSWDDLVKRLVKAATGRDEDELAAGVNAGWANPREREVMRLTGRLRVMLGDAWRQPPRRRVR